jgi:hypothetical protein
MDFLTLDHMTQAALAVLMLAGAWLLYRRAGVAPVLQAPSRKQQHDREASLLLLGGLFLMLWFKGDFQLYLVFAGGVVGKGFVFTQGLGKEYEMKAKLAEKGQ